MFRIGFLRPGLGLLLCFLTLVLPAPAAGQSSGDSRRVALVVGNFNYEHVPRLSNPGNDATLIATTLHQLGFTLIGGGAQENVDKAHFDHLVQDFGRAVQGADVALFYYAGHGMQVDGNNWLVPTDANPTRPQDLEFQMVDAELVLKQMDGAGTRLNLVILDACRNNPFASLGTRAVQGGLAQMRAPEGTMISFATQPGNVAADGSGQNGPYAAALAAAMRKPDVDIFHVFNLVGLTVKRATDGVQQPWVSTSPIDGEFYFNAADAAADPSATTALDIAADKKAEGGGATRNPAAANGPPAAIGASSVPTAVSTQSGSSGDAAGSRSLATLHTLAEQGNASAQVDLGLAYAKGQGTARDDVSARHWFELAAAQGGAQAQFLMGAMLERGRGGPRSYTTAMQWYQRAAEQGYPPAEAAIGRFYGRGLGMEPDRMQRTNWYRRAAEHGNALGEWALGNFYQSGDGVDKDMSLALQWYNKAADQGFVLAERRLGWLYEHGNGVPKNYAEALRWDRLAAAGGNVPALNSLGVFYRQGWAVPQDYAQAMNLFRQAAAKGNAVAEFNIGLLYANGHGVKTDKQQAREWFEQASMAGYQPATDLLDRLNQNCAAPTQRNTASNAGPGHRPPGSC